MAGFRKAKAEQAALKLGIYGASGSGKTFTSLLLGEGLANLTKKRIAYVDTERGTDFYCKAVPERSAHPEAFDFDAMYTRSITDVNTAVEGLGDEYSVIIIDSITHIWEACRNAYSGKTTGAGTIPFHAWGKIKAPYKKLINFLLSSPKHVIFCGRQGVLWQEDEDSGELKQMGYKMKAEGETPYEPHILIRMESVRDTKSRLSTICAYVEKDRTGVLAGKTIEWPRFENVVKPMLSLLGGTQAQIEDEDAVGQKDAEKLAGDEKTRSDGSTLLLNRFKSRLLACETLQEVQTIGKEITPQVKAKMTTADVATLREAYLEAEKVFKHG